MSDRLGVAVLGCGPWGMNYIRLFRELPDAKVVLACDAKADRLQEVQKRFPDVALAHDIDDASHKNGVDAVIVCTNARAHYDATRRCLEAGKHVLIEKPMTTTVYEAEDLIDLADSKRLTLMVGHIFLYNAGIQKVKTCIDDDGIGRIYYLYARRTNLGPIRQDVNALWDLAPHDIAIFNFLLQGRPIWVSAVGAQVLRNGREDVGFISLSYADGVVGHIHVSWADPNKVREVVVVGSNKRIVFNDLSPQEQVRVFEKGIAPLAEPFSYGEYQFFMRDGDIISPKIEPSEPLKNQCQHFLMCVGSGCRPLSDGGNGLTVVQVMEAIDRSIACNGAPVEVR